MAAAAAGEQISDGELARAASVLGTRCGLRFDARTRELLVDGLERAARAEAVPAAELVARLQTTAPDELMQAVLRQVTIGETYFFRHPEHFELLRERVVPELMRDRDRRTFRAWSAGCAAGEEAYSIAIALGEAAPGFDVHVLGTDINKAALATARRGEYGRWSQRGIARQALNGYASALPDGGLSIAPKVKQRVRFDYLNLHDPCYPSLLTATQGLDVIFCRNVLVYFFPEAAEAVLRRFADCLVDGGWLIVSALDVTAPPEGLEMVQDVNTFVLRKTAPRDRPRRATPAMALAARTAVTTPARGVPAAAARIPATTPARGIAAAARLATDGAARSRKPTPGADIVTSTISPGHEAPTLRDAKRAADAGDLALALALGKAATADGAGTPEALHLCALVLAEQGQHAEARTLLERAVAADPSYVLGHLSLGLDGQEKQAAHHLERVIDLVAGRRDDELLPGPDPLPVSWVRKVARAGLRNKGTL